MAMTTLWIIAILGWVTAFVIAFFKGASSDTMPYPTEKDKAETDKMMRVNVRIYNKDGDFLDTGVVRLCDNGLSAVVTAHSKRGDYIIKANLEEI